MHISGLVGTLVDGDPHKVTMSITLLHGMLNLILLCPPLFPNKQAHVPLVHQPQIFHVKDYAMVEALHLWISIKVKNLQRHLR